MSAKKKHCLIVGELKALLAPMPDTMPVSVQLRTEGIGNVTTVLGGDLRIANVEDATQCFPIALCMLIADQDSTDMEEMLDEGEGLDS